MPIHIYIYGCNCGTTGAHVRRAKKYAQIKGYNIEVFNSKYSDSARQAHASYLKECNLDSDRYEPIIVDAGNVVELKSWKPS